MYNRKEKTEELHKFARVLKENGFTVLVPTYKEEPQTWIKFFKNGKFGAVSCSYFSGFDFGTVHKPCRECGTGYGIAQNADLTIDNAEKCLIKAPSWAYSKDVSAIKEYNSVDEFINSSHNQWAKYQPL